MSGRSLRAALLIGAASGFADLLVLEIAGDFRAGYVSSVAWLLVPLVWIIVCLVTSALFSWPPLRRFRRPAIAFAGPGLLVLSRGGPLLKHVTHLSIATATAVSSLAGLVVAITIARIVEVHRRKLEIAGFAILLLTISETAALKASSTHCEHDRIAAESSPNVVLIFLDTVRYDDAQAIPNLQKFASASFVFDNAWAPAPWTLPSHFAVFTGVDPWTVTFDSDRLRFASSAPTLAEEFARRGYRTAAILANPILTPGVGLARGFQSLEDSPPSAPCRSGIGYLLRQVYLRSGRESPVCKPLNAPDVVERAVNFIERGKAPYFVALNFNDAHHPYEVQRGCRERDFKPYTNAEGRQLRDAMTGGALPSSEALVRIHEQYRAALRCMDRSLGVLFSRLEKRPDWNRTVVAVLSDHGEQFGEHGLVGHGNSVYAQVLHVPVILRVPGQPPARFHEPVSISDLHGTLLNLIRASRDQRGLFGGRRPVVAKFSFVGISPKTFAVCSVGATDHLLHWDNGHEELYDYRADPAETLPLRLPADQTEIDRLRQALRSLGRTADGATLFRSLGYIH